MWQGSIVSLHIVAEKSAPMDTVAAVHAIPGKGLKGDRYADGRGTYSEYPEDGRQVTLFEEETLEALHRDMGISLGPNQTRRNIITSGVPLNHLVGQKFLVGEVLLEGTRLNAPCQYFQDLLGIKGLFKALIHRSGLNCRILTEGETYIGDSIRLSQD